MVRGAHSRHGRGRFKVWERVLHIILEQGLGEKGGLVYPYMNPSKVPAGLCMAYCFSQDF